MSSGRVDPSSILGKIIAEDICRQPSVAKLPSTVRDAIAKATIIGLHEPAQPDDDDALWLLNPRTTARSLQTLDAVFPSFGRRQQLVIRDDDLKLIDAVCAGLQAAAGAGFFLLNLTAASEIASITGVIVSIVKVLRQVARKGVLLNSTQVQVILALKKLGPVTVGAITGWLNAVAENHAPPWTDQDVLDQLVTLRNMRLRDGSGVVLVEETADGSWVAVGV